MKNNFNLFISIFVESRKRFTLDGWATVPSEFNSSFDTLTFPSLLNMGKAHEKSHKDSKWESQGEL
jgi:hypothetical protein